MLHIYSDHCSVKDNSIQLKEKVVSIQTLKAVQQHEFGGPEVLRYEDAPVPELQQGEVLVRVHAVGLTPPDWYLRDGYKTLPPHWQPKVSFPMLLRTHISRGCA